MISAEKEDRSVIVQRGEVSAAKCSSVPGRSLIPGTEKFFYGEIGAYNQYFEAVTQSGKKADLLVRLYFSPLTHNDVVKESLLWKDRLQRKYDILMNITVEDHVGKVLFCRNITQTLLFSSEDGVPFPEDDAVWEKLLIRSLRTVALLLKNHFTCYYKIAVYAPSGDKEFPLDEVEILLDGIPVQNQESVLCTKNRHHVKIKVPDGYKDEEYTLTLDRDSKTSVHIQPKGKK